MQVSLVCSNESFLEYLSRATGMTVTNAYKTLVEESIQRKFANDFNYIDVFLFVDFQDLAKEFTIFLKSLEQEKSHFLQAKEIVIVTYIDPKMSPTPDLETNLAAIQAFLNKLKYKFRVVRLGNLKFQDISRAIVTDDTIKDSHVKKLTKYKVVTNGDGIIIPAKKAKTTVVPDSLKGQGSMRKREDLQIAQTLEGVTLEISPTLERTRTESNFTDTSTIDSLDSIVIFITGLRYSGKSSLALLSARELQNLNLTSAVIDLTGRKDMRILSNIIDCDLEIMKGLSSDGLTGKAVVGVEVHNKVFTSSFLGNLTRHILTSRTMSFCEVDPEEFSDLYKSHRGEKLAIICVPNSLTYIRDTINFANGLDFKIVIVVNNIFKSDNDVNLKTLRDSFNTAKSVFTTDSIPELIASLLR